MCIVGLGFGSVTAEQTIPAIAVNLPCKIVFVAFILYVKNRLHWFDKVQGDDVARFNAKSKE